MTAAILHQKAGHKAQKTKAASAKWIEPLQAAVSKHETSLLALLRWSGRPTKDMWQCLISVDVCSMNASVLDSQIIFTIFFHGQHLTQNYFTIPKHLQLHILFYFTDISLNK